MNSGKYSVKRESGGGGDGAVNLAYTGSTMDVVDLGSKDVKSKVNEASIQPNDKIERVQWGNSLEFLMSCLSLSVGLGNIWRFPFTAFENGGGAFLIPYIIVLIVIGKPMYYLEMTLGQFTSSGSVKIWEISPILKGIGYGQMLATICVVSYYCSLIALTLYYLFASMATNLPWAECLQSWGKQCIDSKLTDNSANSSLTNYTSSAELYFFKEVLKEKDVSIADGIGAPEWRLTLYLLLAWTMIFMLLNRGVKSSGKASYFTALFPYVVMIIILGRAASLPGSLNGITYFLKPQWEKLYTAKVWYAATTQVFYSLSVGMGSITMFSSYNRFKHNIYRDAMIVTTCDTFTSLLAGMTIFSILGNLAHNTGVQVKDVAVTGTALAFISYPNAIAKFDYVPQLFAVLFFFMLLVLGIGSVVALHNTVITIFCDQFPKIKYWKVAGVASIFGFFTGLIYLTPGGQWMLSLVDHFGGTFLIFVLAIIEVVSVFWLYGLQNFCDDSEFMSGRRVSAYWRLCWAVITPAFMIITFIYSMAQLETPKYGGWEYPTSAITAGWVLFLIGIIQLPIWAIWVLARTKSPESSAWERVKAAARPSAKWGPKNEKTREEWMLFKEDARERRMKLITTENHSKLRQVMNTLLGRY